MQSVIKEYVLPIQCSPNDAEIRSGDMVRLHLTDTIPNLPTPIVAVVQHPIDRILVINPATNCRVNGYRYTFLYDEAQLEGVVEAISECDILSVECVTCCELLEEQLEAETAARIAADSALQTQVNNEVAARIAGDANLQTQVNNEVAARIGGDLAVTELAESRYVRYDQEQPLSLEQREQAQDNIFPQVDTGIRSVLIDPEGSNNAFRILTDTAFVTATISTVSSGTVDDRVMLEAQNDFPTLLMLTGDKLNMQISADLFDTGSLTTVALTYDGLYNGKPSYVAQDTPSIGEAITLRWETTSNAWVLYTGLAGFSTPSFVGSQVAPSTFPDEILSENWVADGGGSGFPFQIESQVATATQVIQAVNGAAGGTLSEGTSAEIPSGLNGSGFVQNVSEIFVPVMGPPPRGTFESADGKLITVYRGVIVGIEILSP